MVSELSGPVQRPLRGTGSGAAEGLAGLALVAAPVVLLCALVLIPTAYLIGGTFRVEADGVTSLGLDRYAAFFADGYSVANLRFTVILTLVSTVSVLILSLGIALYLRFSTGRIATVVQALSLFPLFVPAIIISYALVRFLGPNGLLQLLLEQVGITGYRTPYLTPVGPYIAFIWENLPLPVLVLTAGLTQVSDHAVEAARDLGAGALRILTEILLPQLVRSLVIAFALVFLLIVGSYTIPFLLGPPAPEMMGVYIARTMGNLQRPDEAAVQSVLLLAVAAVVGVIYIVTMARGARA
ncbi:ABC transporter permease [Tabrizicola sp.]|uniref:ABC transporter permease n=1 Tax=Tabrizicola sp. TaxID=2005166 RepID=UPI003F3D8F9E